MKLVAQKNMHYATRRMLAGDEFEAKDRDARVLIAVKKAKPAKREIGTLPTPPPAVAAALGSPADSETPNPERDALRDLAQARGIAVDGRWGVDRLRDEIEKATKAAEQAAPIEEATHDG